MNIQSGEFTKEIKDYIMQKARDIGASAVYCKHSELEVGTFHIILPDGSSLSMAMGETASPFTRELGTCKVCQREHYNVFFTTFHLCTRTGEYERDNANCCGTNANHDDQSDDQLEAFLYGLKEAGLTYELPSDIPELNEDIRLN